MVHDRGRERDLTIANRVPACDEVSRVRAAARGPRMIGVLTSIGRFAKAFGGLRSSPTPASLPFRLKYGSNNSLVGIQVSQRDDPR